MTKEDITRMAREAGLVRAGDGWTEPHRWGLAEIEAFAALVAAAEREACAKVCEDFYQGLPPKLTVRGYLEDMAKAIRARGNT